MNERQGYVEVYSAVTLATVRVLCVDGRTLTPAEFARIPASDRAYVIHLPEHGPVIVGANDESAD